MDEGALSLPSTVSDAATTRSYADRITVLIVDDIPSALDNLQKLLSFEPDIQVVGTAINGKESIQEVKRLRPDIVLMDVCMPIMDGIQATELITQEVPESRVIAMSVQGTKEYLRRAMESGAREFLIKPFSGDELIAAIRRVDADRTGKPESKSERTSTLPEESGRGQLIFVCSARGGVGKTTVAVNTCAALVQRTHSQVLLVDWDLQFGNVSLLLGIQNSAGIGDIVDGQKTLDLETARKAITTTPYGFDVLLPPTRPELADSVTVDHVRELARLQNVYQYVVVDSSVFLGALNLEWLEYADKVVLVTTPDGNALKITRVLDKLLDSIAVTSDRSLVVNMSHGQTGAAEQAMAVEAGLPVTVQLPYEPGLVSTSQSANIPFVLAEPTREISVRLNHLAEILSEPSQHASSTPQHRGSAPPLENHETRGTQRAHPIKVLIVDDIASTRDNLSKLLSFEPDIQVVGTAPDGKEGIEQATKLAPNIVVMGINMPVMDGITATRRLSEALPIIRVIVMSVQGEPDYVQAAFQAGAFDFLQKPFSGDELISSIRFVWEVASDDGLRVFRAAMAKSDAPTLAQTGASLLDARLVAWRTLVQMRYTFTWANEARTDPQLMESANGTGIDDLIASARLATEAQLRAKEANQTAMNAWQIAQHVVDRVVDPSTIYEQYAIAAAAHHAAESGAQQVREAMAKLKANVPAPGKMPANKVGPTKVLIVEDNPVNVRLAQHLLEKHGFEVRKARSGAECLTELARELPDIIVMEIQLPDEDGLRLTRRIRANSRTTDLTIVACTAHAMPGDREKILAAGCDGYIRKPVDPANFASDVAGYLKQRKLKATTAATPNGTAVSIANERRPATTSPVPSQSAEGAQNLTDSFDHRGSRFRRASSDDFRTLPRRVVEIVQAIPGFEGNEELGDYMTQAATLYERGDYLEAHRYLTTSLERLPALRPYVFYYIRRCERVLATPPTIEEKQYEAQLRQYLARPRWLRTLTARPPLKLRCKWCGRYTPYIDPNRPTYGFISEANSCHTCGRMYPMPSWSWDAPDGRAYSYYRHSFADNAFYEEFERDYDPRPRRTRSGSPANIADERKPTTLPPGGRLQRAPRTNPTGDAQTTIKEVPLAASRNSQPGGDWRLHGEEKWEAFQAHYRSCRDCLKTGAQTDLCVRGASLLEDVLGPETLDPSQRQDEQLFLNHIHGCRICKQVAGHLAMCAEGKQLSDRWLTSERLVRPRRQAQAMGEAVFGYQLSAHASSRRHQQRVENVWDAKTYEVTTQPIQGTGAWRARVSSIGGFLKRTQDLYVAPVDGRHTPEDIHARLVAMAQFQRPQEWVVSEKTFRDQDERSQAQPGAGGDESGDLTNETAIRDELAQSGIRPDAQVFAEAAGFEGGRISPCPDCSGPSAMDLQPRQVRFWLRLTLNKESGTYALTCYDCGSVEPLAVGMLDWALRTVANLNKVLGPEVIH